MEKEELIKFLNKNMNELKEKNIKSKILLENSENLPIEVNSSDIKINKLLTKVIAILGLIQSVNLLNAVDSDKNIYFNSLVFIYIALLFKITVKKMLILDTVENDINILNECISSNSEKINNLQMAIDFLQSLTKEEEKYLKLKI